MEFILENWAPLLIGILAFVKVVVNLTPTDRDNVVFGLLDRVINSVIRDRRR